ncbi:MULTISPECIES: GtrA family protein [unclassified Ornithinimicrobium]|uniref:GtrA family protein n=1 Tax=unclassified Ornithinimicrobium TaxID=2615080 RepID=UPI0038528F30
MTNALERPPDLSTGPAVTAATRFAALRDAGHALLPAWLGRLVPATAIGFAVLSSLTYAIDLLVLAVLFDGLALPYPVAVTGGYLVAFTLAFVLNRWLNFQSHGSVGRQSQRYVLTVAANYVLFILLLATTLEALGVQYLVARLVAGAGEAVFMYLMMRFVIFRQRSA